MLGISIEFVWIFGLILLGAVMFFFGTRPRPLSGAERKRSDEVAKENWGKENVR
ncbi:MAG TPA: hypothetical protein VGU45_16125 [Microvirga sp.]|jgi:hypothetical protein|nr:hypothetical protein [Microvirga sp.]